MLLKAVLRVVIFLAVLNIYLVVTSSSVPGLGDKCDNVCSLPDSVVYINHTCVCKPPLTDIADHRYCVTEPGPVVNFSIAYIGEDTADLTWGAPATAGVIQEYHLFVVADGECQQGNFWACHGVMSPSFTTRKTGCSPVSMLGDMACRESISVQLKSLLPYTNYTFTVNANNDLYYGHNTTLLSRTKIAAAHEPSNVLVTVQSSTTIMVNWNTPDIKTGPTWYTVTVHEATGRQSSDLTSIRTISVDGYNSTSCQVSGLLPSWVYSFSVTAHTTTGNSEAVNASTTVTTLPSVPGPVENLTIAALNSPLMGVELSWSCPDERKRNGRINNYTVHYTGDVFANAEFKGQDVSTVFHAGRSRIAFLLPSGVTTNKSSVSTTFIVVSVVMGLVIIVLSLTSITLIYKTCKRRESDSEGIRRYRVNVAL